MSQPLHRSMRVLRHSVWLFVSLIALSWSLASVAAAYPDNSGPQLFINTNVAERGATVTITLNGFAANQQLTVTVRAASDSDQGATVATVPVQVDANGNGTGIVSTNGLATGNYIVTVAGADGVPLSGVQTAFGVIDPGTAGPRIVRVHPALSDEG